MDWYLRKHEDGNVFGPLSFEQLSRWAATARIAPHDLVSCDQQNWVKAPMLAELGMDWLVELSAERYYGPTTLGAIGEFIRLGEVSQDSFVINTCDGSRRKLQELETLFPTLREEPNGAGGAAGGSSMSKRFEERIRDLERSLGQERQAYGELEKRYRELEQRYQELIGGSEKTG